MRFNRLTKIILSTVLLCSFVLTGCSGNNVIFSYEFSEQSTSGITSVVGSDTLYKASNFSDQVCVIPEDNVGKKQSETLTADGILLVNMDKQKMMYSKNIYNKMYPASLTKIATALVCLKYGNMQDDVTVSYLASHITEPGAKVCFLQEGDVVNFEVLLTSFLVYSGNDAGIALAEHIAGSEEEFMKLVNKEMAAIGAVDTNFVNSHGLPDDNHYTTVYDMYLLMNELCKYDKFLEITALSSYVAKFKDKSGNDVTKVYENTDKFLTGEKKLPNGVKILASKTGTTLAAGSCLILMSEGANNNRYISIVMKAYSSDSLYSQMTELLKKTS